MGRGAIVIGLAAVIIGEVIFGKVFRNFALKMLAVAIGAILYYLVYQVVIWLGLNTDDMKLITALIVAAFLAIPYWKGKYAHVKVPAGSANACLLYTSGGRPRPGLFRPADGGRPAPQHPAPGV